MQVPCPAGSTWRTLLKLGKPGGNFSQWSFKGHGGDITYHHDDEGRRRILFSLLFFFCNLWWPWWLMTHKSFRLFAIPFDSLHTLDYTHLYSTHSYWWKVKISTLYRMPSHGKASLLVYETTETLRFGLLVLFIMGACHVGRNFSAGKTGIPWVVVLVEGTLDFSKFSFTMFHTHSSRWTVRHSDFEYWEANNRPGPGGKKSNFEFRAPETRHSWCRTVLPWSQGLEDLSFRCW